MRRKTQSTLVLNIFLLGILAGGGAVVYALLNDSADRTNSDERDSDETAEVAYDGSPEDEVPSSSDVPVEPKGISLKAHKAAKERIATQKRLAAEKLVAAENRIEELIDSIEELEQQKKDSKKDRKYLKKFEIEDVSNERALRENRQKLGNPKKSSKKKKSKKKKSSIRKVTTSRKRDTSKFESSELRFTNRTKHIVSSVSARIVYKSPGRKKAWHISVDRFDFPKEGLKPGESLTNRLYVLDGEADKATDDAKLTLKAVKLYDDEGEVLYHNAWTARIQEELDESREELKELEALIEKQASRTPRSGSSHQASFSRK